MKYTKPSIVVLIFAISLAAIGKIFWEQELKYARPTPVPEDYTPVQVKQKLDQHIALLRKGDKPKHLHFFNPDCPCSRFNRAHFSSLLRKYGDKIDFYIVIPHKENLEQVAEEFDDTVPVIVDKNKKIAKACGVYSTPQAVVIDSAGRLYYKGNYNKARYCTNASTSYAALALKFLLDGKPAPYFGLSSTTAYGCELNKKYWLSSLIF